MNKLTWLHLSDWHQQGKDFDRNVVRDALMKDIEERVKIHPDLQTIDFIVFSGDVARNGKPVEYEAAALQLFDPLLKACELPSDRLIIVPGNHDLDRDEFELLPEALTKPLKTEDEVKNWFADSRKRARMLEPFRSTRFL